MYKPTSKIFQKIFSLAFFSLAFLFTAALNVQAASVTITSPNGGEEYAVGETVLIFWESDTQAQCSFYYITPEGGPSMAYYVGSASSSANFLAWIASKPSSEINTQQAKIQMTCAGLPTDYSDDYFTVSGPSVTPTITPTVTPTPTPAPICDRSALLAYSSTASVSAYREQTVNNNVLVTNPNDPECGSKLYGLSRSYPGGWNMELQNYVTVGAGETVSVPLSITSDNNADYKTYQYFVGANDWSGGATVGVSNNVTIIPRCDLTVEASLLSASQSAFPGSILTNTLILTNPNHTLCGTKTYIYSRSIPSGWSLNIQPNVTVASGQTVSVPMNLLLGGSTSVGSYNYSLWVYNSWADGSGQAQVSGVVNVLDNIVPVVSIISPLNNSTVTRNKSFQISAIASDNVGVSRVEFYVNGALVCTDTIASYNCSFTTINRKGIIYTLMVKAYDAANNVATTTSIVTTK